MRRRSGFTLIEMMIVLAIIAALAATLVPIAMNALNQAKVTGNLTDVESIRMAEMQYWYKYDTTTASKTALDIYLTWANLQAPNNSTYNLTVPGTGTTSNQISIGVNFGSAALAKAFEAQFPTESPDVVSFTRPDDSEVATVTYQFQ